MVMMMMSSSILAVQVVGVVMVSCNRVVMVMMLKSISNLAMEEVKMMMLGCVRAVQGGGVGDVCLCLGGDRVQSRLY